ncbi:hypothetical protein [Saccharopolyspora mangrovi]|uniref:HTH-type transcriptional repressor KstR2 C-terminal domain-containing protein n=1 Tax=Saccharopolyspora mangrovi TaxID=3082379 RepID=A0ABU6AJQ3_9PSEU|nr:hypothetical protein [Saccharopolyspora sp. S2-29]MEB3371733.1 hypothetical protein [Saccharopolyspora sp. S2-29]
MCGKVVLIVAIGSHVSSWYKPRGKMSLDTIVDTYTEMIFRQIGFASVAAPAVSSPFW